MPLLLKFALRNVRNVRFLRILTFLMSFFLHGDIDNFGDIANIATFATLISTPPVIIVSCSYIFLVVR